MIALASLSLIGCSTPRTETTTSHEPAALTEVQFGALVKDGAVVVAPDGNGRGKVGSGRAGLLVVIPGPGGVWKAVGGFQDVPECVASAREAGGICVDLR